MRGDSGKRDTFAADAKELQEHFALEVHAKRMNANEIIVVTEGDQFMFPCASGLVKQTGKDSEVRTSDQIRQGAENMEEHSSEYNFR